MRRVLFVFAVTIVAIILTLVTAAVPVSESPNNSTVGAITSFGLPFPFRECAPGWSRCRFTSVFFLDVLLFFVLFWLSAWGLLRLWRGQISQRVGRPSQGKSSDGTPV